MLLSLNVMIIIILIFRMLANNTKLVLLNAKFAALCISLDLTDELLSKPLWTTLNLDL